MASNALLLEATRVGNSLNNRSFSDAAVKGQNIRASQQQMGLNEQMGQQRNALFQNQQEDRQRQMQAEEQERLNNDILNAAAPMLMPGVTEEQASAYWQQNAPAIKQKYPQLQVPEQYPGRQALVGMLPLPPQLRDKLFESALAPKQPTGNLPTEEIGVGNGMFQRVQILADGSTRPLGQPYRKAADAGVELRRDLAEMKREEAAQKKAAADQAFQDQAGDSISIIDQMIGSEDGTVPQHPGLSTAVGVKGVTGGLLAGVVLPGTEAADFLTLYNQSKGKQFLEAFQTLKGGGQITQIEGEKATQAIARMDRSQKEEDFIKAAKEFRTIIKRGLDRKRAQQAVGADTRLPNATVAPNGIKFLGFEK